MTCLFYPFARIIAVCRVVRMRPRPSWSLGLGCLPGAPLACMSCDICGGRSPAFGPTLESQGVVARCAMMLNECVATPCRWQSVGRSSSWRQRGRTWARAYSWCRWFSWHRTPLCAKTVLPTLASDAEPSQCTGYVETALANTCFVLSISCTCPGLRRLAPSPHRCPALAQVFADGCSGSVCRSNSVPRQLRADAGRADAAGSSEFNFSGPPSARSGLRLSRSCAGSAGAQRPLSDAIASSAVRGGSVHRRLWRGPRCRHSQCAAAFFAWGVKHHAGQYRHYAEKHAQVFPKTRPTSSEIAETWPD